MNRARIFAGAGAGLAFATLGWFLPDVPNASPGLAAGVLSRSVGLVLLAIAMIAAGLAFRAAMRAEQKPASATIRPRASEYRRGFGDRSKAQAPWRSPAQHVVVSLRDAIEQGKAPAAAGTVLPAAEIERLQDMLHNRVTRLVIRRGDLTNPSFPRRGVDLRDLAPE